ncbi:MAG: NAD(P)/FAD-dependent oxidoreductase [Pseudomonadales bacterium]
MFTFNDNTPVSFQDELPEKSDVVIIGAGVIGISTAWFLRQRGLSVVVCDKGRVAGEQSSRNWGWVRSTGRDPYEVPIAMASTNLWEQFQKELGDGIGFTRRGIAMLINNDKEMAECEQWLDVAREYKLDTKLLTADEVDSTFGVPPGQWRGALYTASDGRAEPFTAVPTLAREAQARGVRIRENCAVRTVERQAGRVSAVCTENGRIETQQVLCAAGAWSSLFMHNLGVRFPQLTVKATVARTESCDSVFDGAAGLHDIFIRRRQDGGYTIASEAFEHFISANSFRYLLNFIPSLASVGDIRLRLGRDPSQQSFIAKKWNGDQVSPFEANRVLNPEPSASILKLIRDKLSKRIPALANVHFAETWAGMIDTTPDVVPVMDEVSSCPGLYLASGFSGHGFGIGPGAGEVMADLMTGKKPPYDMSRFRFSRFSDGSKLDPGPAI